MKLKLLLLSLTAAFALILLSAVRGQGTLALAQSEGVELLRPEVLAEYPHDAGSFTQGLVWHDGLFYESAGNYGESDVRQVQPTTGEVLQIYELGDAFFAEGLALVDDRLIQITWTNGTAFVYDREDLRYRRAFRYEGEGWGLCYDGEFLYMSDGTEVIDVRDPQTFALLEEITVTYEGQPVSAFSVQERALDDINELECVGDSIYANVWQTDVILRLDKATGAVNGIIDATGLLSEDQVAGLEFGAVLNGIAYNPDEDVFYLTGKLWPALFEVRFVPVEAAQ